MTFSEKLRLLMDITKTTNSTLARYVSLDASYISRLRSGKRMAPRNDSSVKSMATYFARNCRDVYQKKAMADTIGLNSFPEDFAVLSNAITHWLINERDEETDTVKHLLHGFSTIQARSVTGTDGESDFPRKDIAIYYGVEGKRKAAIYFLNEVISLEKPQTLLMFSDEETSWMTGDPLFSRKWAALMMKLLSRGHHIKIIHTVSRDLDEMLNAINQWMPLYITGTIEPYFYPKKRDGVFRNTLIISPGTAAVVSSSMGIQSGKEANFLIRDPEAVKAFEEQFAQYLSLCRPLMLVFNEKDRDAYQLTLADFEKEKSRTIVKTESLSLLTMPETLFHQILSRAGLDNMELAAFQQKRLENFLQTVRVSGLTEIIYLPEQQDVINGQIKVALLDMMEISTICYTVEEYILHLHNIVELLNTYRNYHVHLIKNNVEEKFMAHVKEDKCVILIKNSLPTVALAICEGNVTAAFWDYLKIIIGEKSLENPDNKLMAEKLCKYIEGLVDAAGGINY